MLSCQKHHALLHLCIDKAAAAAQTEGALRSEVGTAGLGFSSFDFCTIKATLCVCVFLCHLNLLIRVMSE